jgi:hypothetical protein
MQVTRKQVEDTFQEVWDPVECDTRYGAGCADFYAKVVGKLTHKEYDRYISAAEEFIKETKEYHEKNRWEFRPHPNFFLRIQELAGDKKIVTLK